MQPLDAPYDQLEALPRELWLPGLVTGVGPTAQRLADVAHWLAALERGELPDTSADFGDPQALAPMRAVVGEFGLPVLCRGTPALAQQVLRTLLWHLDRVPDQQPRLTRRAALDAAATGFRDEWELQMSGWEEMLALMQGLGELAQLTWDELRGVLTSREWREAQRISAMLAHLQPLAEVIRALGRSRPEAHRPPTPSPQAQPLRQKMPQRERETHLPDAPGEVMGIRHSDRLERMLGSEAAQIRHPVLHKLWRARLAESRLLTYQSEAVLLERVPDPSARAREHAAATPPEARSRGPIILCLDTSGSMKGAPETVAKAVALEALRVARLAQRSCLLVAFGGPGEIVERELGANRAGLQALLDLMGQGFDGGTDVQTPIEHAIQRVRGARWRQADLLIVSDGEFGCTAATLAQLDAARVELGLRVQGILVGDRETMGLLDVCDHIHWLRDWRRYDGAAPQREQRSCLLVAFGGPGEIVERELGANRAGLHALLDLMGQGFDGGTDVQTPIEHAIQRVRGARWHQADLLIVSDGEFGCTAATLAQLDAARAELGLRVHGILVGDRETMGLLDVCDHIHWLRDWRRYEGAAPQREGFVPVHSQSLTALYFPNALSERAARHRR